MRLQTLHRGPDRNLTYLFGPDTPGPLAAVDPGADTAAILEAAGGRPISMIFATHGHEDHIEGIAELKSKTGAIVLAHRLASADFEKRRIPLDVPLSGGERFELGGVPLRVIFTPGHHPAAISIFVADRWLFTGDTLFVGNCGRTDLPGGSAATLFVTLQMLAGLPDAVIVLPGHDYGPRPSSTIGDEKRENPTLRARSFAEFQAIP